MKRSERKTRIIKSRLTELEYIELVKYCLIKKVSISKIIRNLIKGV